MKDSFYITGGTLPYGSRSYVEREADRQLFRSLLRGEYCYVLTARQMGKSSLMVHVANRLRARGVHAAIMDLTSFGQNLTVEQWYEGLMLRLCRQFDLDDEMEDFWMEHRRLSPVQRFFMCVHDLLLPKLQDKRFHDRNTESSDREILPEDVIDTTAAPSLVIFVDELDVVRSLPFSTDEFFAAIRESFTRRAEEPRLAQLSFCLLGVATPADLIQNIQITPFNIARRVALNDFTLTEAKSLAQVLHPDPEVAAALLDRVIYWTGGHPYLTQLLCKHVSEDATADTPAEVDRYCREVLTSNASLLNDPNLIFVRDSVLRSRYASANLLELYRQVHSSTALAVFTEQETKTEQLNPVADCKTDPLVNHLHLTGIVRSVNGILWVRNRVYFKAFNKAWIEGIQAEIEQRPPTSMRQRSLPPDGTPLDPAPVEPSQSSEDEHTVPTNLVPVRMSPKCNAALSSGGPCVAGKPIGASPSIRSVSGILFSVGGLIWLAGREKATTSLPRQIEDIVIGQRCRRLYILHGAVGQEKDATQIGYFTVHLEQDHHRFVPIIYGQDVFDLNEPLNDRPSETGAQSVKLKELLPKIEKDGKSCLYVTTWENPWPDQFLTSIDYASCTTSAAPFLAAMTLEQ